MTYRYNAFGLNIHSSIEIPEMTPHDETPDVRIELGRVPDKLKDPALVGVRFQAKPGVFWMKKDNTAKYLAEDGARIVVERFPDARDRDVRLYLLGSVLGAILHQREMLPLHASAVRVNGQCVLFCGRSGAGKSTIAKALMMRGFRFHSDDICVLKMPGNGDEPMVYPGYPQIKLWEDAMDELGVGLKQFPRVRQAWHKYAVPVEEATSLIPPLPLKKIYILFPHNQKQIRMVPLGGAEKVSALKDQTYRYHLVGGLGKTVQHFRLAAELAEKAQVTDLYRPQKPFLLDQLTSFLENDMTS